MTQEIDGSTTTTTTTTTKAYDAKSVEQRWYSVWEQAGVFAPDVAAVKAGKKKPYVIMMPPPNVTGTLHMGHALFVTLQDILIRTHRMRGEAALWLPGVDHAGIATQAVVERELMRHEKKSRHDVGREEFLRRVWDWKEKNGDRIVEQLKAMGASADWSRERFTMDEQCNRAVKEAFVRLWDEGLIYRGERLVNWDPGSNTALSDEEVDSEERDGELWRFAYPLKTGTLVAKPYASPHDAGKQASAMVSPEGTPEIVVATTRPETMLGDVAVAVHPKDPRYTALVGKELLHPFFPERKVIVVASDDVDMELGTGAVKLTPAHDPIDFERGRKHGLPSIRIFDFDMTISKEGGPFAGLERTQARKVVKAALEELGLFRGKDAHKQTVPVSQRSKAVIEPMLSRQFFVKTGGFAKEALDIVATGQTRIIPEWWKKTWDHFMENIRDWNISRQLWWGHRIPVFYDLTKIDEAIEADANKKGGDTEAVKAQARGVLGKDLLRIALDTLDEDFVRVFAVASVEDLAAQEPNKYVQEDDVLDTWFSSGLWPFSTLGWPDKTDELAAFYPGAVLETGSDILFFWVARMVWLGKHFMGKTPFSDVFLHAMVRDGAGKKMSKSEGNAVDPLDVIAGITLEDLLAKTRTYPVPEKKLANVLKGLEREFPKSEKQPDGGIPPAGADGLRFTLAALSSQGRDVKLSIPRAQGYKHFLNKIWNAAVNYVEYAKITDAPALADVRDSLTLADRWILSRLQRTAQQVSDAIDAYRFDDAANVMYQFFWTELCDVYVEATKLTIDKPATRATLIHALDVSMRLLHPICPFQTEEIWQRLPGRDKRWPDVKFCAVAPWPTAEHGLVDERAERDMGVVLEAVTIARNLRQESGLQPRSPVAVDLVSSDAAAFDLFGAHAGLIGHLAALSSVSRAKGAGYNAPKLSAVQSTGLFDVVVHLEGLIDVEKEKARLQKEIDKAKKEREALEKRFANADFVQKAPPEVVTEGRANMKSLEERVARLSAALARIGA